jgi:Trypsin-co-occurring domain 1
MPVDSDGTDLLVVEVDDAQEGGLVLAAAPDLSGGIARAQVTLEEALNKLKPSLRKVAHLLKELSPDEAEVEFGLKIGGETGVIVAKGTAEVNFVVRMTWRGSGPAE